MRSFPSEVRARRFITLQDRLGEGFLYSMNGRPPASTSREMIAMVAYLAFIWRGAVDGKGFPDQGFVTVKATAPPNLHAVPGSAPRSVRPVTVPTVPASTVRPRRCGDRSRSTTALG